MGTLLQKTAFVALFGSMLASLSAGQERGSVLASGTLNLVLANKNGFVIAADSRMSSDKLFECESRLQLYCDNSQKLFRTGTNSALAIAGFAVERRGTPLDLAVASVLRRRFGTSGLADERGTVEFASDWVERALGQALTGVAALHDPAPALPLIATFAGFDEHGSVVIKRLVFAAVWRPTGPRGILTPEFQAESTQETVGKFIFHAEGITSVARAILDGAYKSDDPVIRDYYQKLAGGQRDNVSLQEMRALAQVILRETRNFTSKVGGEDQIGVFPVAGNVEWKLPTLPAQTQLSSNFRLWKGVLCRNSQPPCTGGESSFFDDFQHPIDEPRPEFFLASEFKNVPIALDNNYFVGTCFDGATLKWRGGPFFLRTGGIDGCFKQCTIELPQGGHLPSDSELNGKCRIVERPEVGVD